MPRYTDDPRTKGLHIKLTAGEEAAIRAAAKADRLEWSVWARRILLRELDRRQSRLAGTPTPSGEEAEG